MAFSRNSGYATGTGNPNSDVTIQDGGGNIPTLYIDTATDPVSLYKFDGSKASGSRWILLKSAPTVEALLTDVANNVGASLTVVDTWEALSISSAVTKTHTNTSDALDAITVDDVQDGKIKVSLRGILDTSNLTVDTGNIKVRLYAGDSGVPRTESIFYDNAGGVIQIDFEATIDVTGGETIAFEMASSAGTGNVTFDNIEIFVTN